MLRFFGLKKAEIAQKKSPRNFILNSDEPQREIQPLLPNCVRTPVIRLKRIRFSLPLSFFQNKIIVLKTAARKTRSTTHAEKTERLETSIKTEEDVKAIEPSPNQQDLVESSSSVPIVKSEEKETDLKSHLPRHGSESGSI